MILYFLIWFCAEIFKLFCNIRYVVFLSYEIIKTIVIIIIIIIIIIIGFDWEIQNEITIFFTGVIQWEAAGHIKVFLILKLAQ